MFEFSDIKVHSSLYNKQEKLLSYPVLLIQQERQHIINSANSLFLCSIINNLSRGVSQKYHKNTIIVMYFTNASVLHVHTD